MYRLRRNAMTLLEMMIAMMLTTVILTTLAYFYRQVTWVNSQMDKIHERSFQLRYVENRLMSILPRAIAYHSQNTDYMFFTPVGGGDIFKAGSDSLVFSFDNCVQLDKAFSSHVVGRLYLDNEGSFSLATWPSPKRWEEAVELPMKKEVLLEGVEEMRIFYFAPPLKGKPPEGEEGVVKKETLPQDMRGKWSESWSQEFLQLPALVRIELKVRSEERDKEPEIKVFVIFLPHTKQPVTYDS